MSDQLKNVLQSERSVPVKLKYLWGYYWKTLAVIAALLLSASFMVGQVLGRKDSVFSTALYTENSSVSGAETLKKTISNWLPPVKSKQEVTVSWIGIKQTNALAKLSAGVSDGSVDLLITEKHVFKEYAAAGMCQPLSSEVRTRSKDMQTYTDKRNQVVGISAADIPNLKRVGLTDQVLFIPRSAKHQQAVRTVLLHLVISSVVSR